MQVWITADALGSLRGDCLGCAAGWWNNKWMLQMEVQRCDKNSKRRCGKWCWIHNAKGWKSGTKVTAHSTGFEYGFDCVSLTSPPHPPVPPSQGSSCRIQTARWVSSGSERRTPVFTPAPPATSAVVSTPQPPSASSVRQPHAHTVTETPESIHHTLSRLSPCAFSSALRPEIAVVLELTSSPLTLSP